MSTNLLVLLLAGFVAHSHAQDCMRNNTVYVEGSCLSTTLADCQAKCSASPTCNFYTWNSQTLGCGLRNFPIGGVLDAPTQFSGTPFTSAVLQNAVFVSSVKKGLTQGGCIQACLADMQCQSWTWYTAGVAAGACYLNYETPLANVSVPGPTTFISGLRTCFPSPCPRAFLPPGAVLVIKRGQFGNPDSFFNRSYSESELGYGDPNKDFFIGLQALSSLTSTGTWRANITTGLLTGQINNYGYSSFKVGSAASNYQLTVGGFWTPPGQNETTDTFTYHNGAPWSAYNRDNDQYTGNCAAQFGAPNWHIRCFRMGLLFPSTQFYWGNYLANATMTITKV